jgi:hypothetical protein
VRFIRTLKGAHVFAHHPREALQAHAARRLRAAAPNHAAAPNADLLKNRSRLSYLFVHINWALALAPKREA